MRQTAIALFFALVSGGDLARILRSETRVSGQMDLPWSTTVEIVPIADIVALPTTHNAPNVAIPTWSRIGVSLYCVALDFQPQLFSISCLVIGSKAYAPKISILQESRSRPRSEAAEIEQAGPHIHKSPLSSNATIDINT